MSRIKRASKGTDPRISDELLDELLAGRDPAELFHSGVLVDTLKKRVAERALQAEMDLHLSRDAEVANHNSRNGHNRKTVLTESGAMELAALRDRHGSFEPQLVEKYCRRLPDFDRKVLSMFANGMSTRRIRNAVLELYGVEISAELVSKVTDSVLEEWREWQSRPLERCYPIVYLDAIHVKIREGGTVATQAVYLALGIREDGCKEALGLWVGEREGAKFWLGVLNQLKNRGVEDILIAVVDGLKGFPDALEAAFPKTTVQTCIVHLLRYSLCCASYTERRELSLELKKIYQAPDAASAESALEDFETSELGKRYPDVVESWRRNWTRVIPYFAFSAPIRKAITTTNAIESLNSSVRRAVKARGHFTSETAAEKLIYLALREVSGRWQAPPGYWGTAKREFAIHFGERFQASPGYLTS